MSLAAKSSAEARQEELEHRRVQRAVELEPRMAGVGPCDGSAQRLEAGKARYDVFGDAEAGGPFELASARRDVEEANLQCSPSEAAQQDRGVGDGSRGPAAAGRLRVLYVAALAAAELRKGRERR